MTLVYWFLELMAKLNPVGQVLAMLSGTALVVFVLWKVHEYATLQR